LLNPLVDVLVAIWQGNPEWHYQRHRSTEEVKRIKIVEIYGNATKALMIDQGVDKRELIEDVLPSDQPCFENKYIQIQHGFLASDSKYVMIFDNDDIMYNGMMEQLLAKAEEKNAAVVYCNYEMMDADGKHLRYVDLNPRYDWELNCQQACYPDISLWRRDTINECGGYDVSNGRYVMWWLWLQAGLKCPERIFHVPYYGFRYRIHSEGLHNKEKPSDREKFMAKIAAWKENRAT